MSMLKPKTFLDLCFSMRTGALVQVNNQVGYIKAIEKEDGSGACYNLTLSPLSAVGSTKKPEPVKAFVRVES